MSKSELRALYRRRWQVELDLRNIKTTLGMEPLRCKTPEMVRKELWVVTTQVAKKSCAFPAVHNG